MKLKINEQSLRLFDNKLANIQCINYNYFIVRKIKENSIETYNKMEIMSQKIKSAPLDVSCPEDFGFVLLTPSQIKEFFSNKKELFPSLSLYFEDKNGVFIVQTDDKFKVLYKDFISQDLEYIDELEKLYVNLIGTKIQFNPDTTPYSWIT